MLELAKQAVAALLRLHATSREAALAAAQGGGSAEGPLAAAGCAGGFGGQPLAAQGAQGGGGVPAGGLTLLLLLMAR